MKKIILFALLILTPGGAFALQTSGPDELVVRIKGIVCSFCAYGIEKNMSRLKFLDKEAKGDGVLVDIKEGLITLAIDPEEPIDVAKLEKAVKKGGYDLVEIYLTLKGRLRKENGSVILASAGSGQEFILVGPKGEPWNSAETEGQETTVRGVIPGSFLESAKLHKRLQVQVLEGGKTNE